MILFSIIIPIFNGLPYLQACIESVLHQSYPHFEIWVPDSGSSDGSIDYLQQLNDERIKIITTSKRLSITENWNQIKELPLAPYATILGQDDILDPHFLEDMVALIGQHPDAGLYTAPFRLINAQGQTIRNAKPLKATYTVDELAVAMFGLEIDVSATGFVFKTEHYKAFGGIPLFPNLLYSDYALWLGLTQMGYLSVAPRPSFAFRIHSNTSQTTQGFTYLSAMEEFSTFLQRHFQQTPAVQAKVQSLIAGYVTHYAQMIVHRVLATPAHQRNGETVATVISRLDKIIADLSGNRTTSVKARWPIRLAAWIDRLPVARSFYRKWRSRKYKNR